MVVNPPADMLNQITASKKVNVSTIDSFDVDFIGFNCKSGPFKDKNVRKAISYAIDRKSIDTDVVKKSGCSFNITANGKRSFHL